MVIVGTFDTCMVGPTRWWQKKMGGWILTYPNHTKLRTSELMIGQFFGGPGGVFSTEKKNRSRTGKVPNLQLGQLSPKIITHSFWANVDFQETNLSWLGKGVGVEYPKIAEVSLMVRHLSFVRSFPWLVFSLGSGAWKHQPKDIVATWKMANPNSEKRVQFPTGLAPTSDKWGWKTPINGRRWMGFPGLNFTSFFSGVSFSLLFSLVFGGPSCTKH